MHLHSLWFDIKFCINHCCHHIIFSIDIITASYWTIIVHFVITFKILPSSSLWSSLPPSSSSPSSCPVSLLPPTRLSRDRYYLQGKGHMTERDYLSSSLTKLKPKKWAKKLMTQLVEDNVVLAWSKQDSRPSPCRSESLLAPASLPSHILLHHANNDIINKVIPPRSHTRVNKSTYPSHRILCHTESRHSHNTTRPHWLTVKKGWKENLDTSRCERIACISLIHSSLLHTLPSHVSVFCLEIM